MRRSMPNVSKSYLVSERITVAPSEIKYNNNDNNIETNAYPDAGFNYINASFERKDMQMKS